MGIDSNIALSYRPPEIESPLNALAKVMQVKGLQSQQDLAAYTLKKAQREDEDTNALRASLAEPGADVGNALLRLGKVKEYSDYQKSQNEALKTKSEIGKNDVETEHKAIGIYRDASQAIADPQGAVAFVTTMHADPRLKNSAIAQVPLDQLLAQIPQDPAQLAGWKQQFALGATKFMELNKPTTHFANTGGATQVVQTPGLGGAPQVVGSMQNTQSPDNAATNATTRRGQDMTDARTREQTSATITKPFEITGEDGKPVLVQQDKAGNITPVAGYGPKQGASKPLTDTQAKALQFGSRMQAAEDIFAQLAEKGITTSVPGSRAGAGVGAIVNALQPAERQRLDQAKRDFINAVLRRESGAAISPSEFDSAEKQYFPQPGETDPGVLAQKTRNRQLATRGILAEVPDSENRVAKVRSGGATPSGPKPGLVQDGYRFKGGDPADPKSWEKQ